MTETRTWSSGGIAPTTRAAAGNGRRVKGSETRGEFDDEECIGGVPPILVLILKRCRTRRTGWMTIAISHYGRSANLFRRYEIVDRFCGCVMLDLLNFQTTFLNVAQFNREISNEAISGSFLVFDGSGFGLRRQQLQSHL
jgi:hypothetical protein